MIDETEQTAVASEEDYFESLLQGGGAACDAPLLTLTASAAEKVRTLLEQEHDAPLGLRVFVAGGGCSGLQYGMTLDEAQGGDSVLALEGLRVLVDQMNAPYLRGHETDYLYNLTGA